MAERTKNEEAQELIKQRLAETEVRMSKAIEALHKELGSIRTGRATPALVERVEVDYYGSATPLQSLASISAPDARSLLIQPYDKGAIGAIEKAIQQGDLGLVPNNDGQVIRIAIPQLNEERREEFVRLVGKKAEEARVSIRNIRRDEVEYFRKVEKDGHIGKDEVEDNIGAVQRITDRFVVEVDKLAAKKDAELR